MARKNSEFLSKARRACDKLVERLLDHPDVRLIDIGFAPKAEQESEQLVLRIHVGAGWLQAKPEDRVSFPKQVDGIPVIVVAGDYRVEDGN